MEYRIKRTYDGRTIGDSMISLHEDEGTVTLSDWYLGPSVEDSFGDSDLEEYYEFSIGNFLRLKGLLAQEYQPMPVEEFGKEEMEFYNAIQNCELKNFMPIVFTYLKTRDGYSLAHLARDEDIEVKSYSF